MKNRRDRNQVALEAFETLAERYAALVDTKPENAYYERPAMLSLLPPVNGKRILDAGCGPGSYSEWLVEHSAKVTGVDVSPKMVQLAQRRLGKRVKVHQADLGRPLDFLENGTFDIVISPLVLDYIEDWESVFTEFSRLLRDSGLLVFSMEHPSLKFTESVNKDYFATELIETEWRGFGIPVQVPSYRRSLGSMVSALTAAGFVIERMVEPRPTEMFRKKDPDTYQRLSKHPGFLCIRARKETLGGKTWRSKERAPLQVLVIPFKRPPLQFCISRRRDGNYWQWIAGGANVNEELLQAAKREFQEETGLDKYRKIVRLESMCSIPTEKVVGCDYWENTFVVTEFSFAVELFDKDELIVGPEHTEHKWCSYEEATNLLKYDSNKNALTELYRRIEKNSI